MLYNASTMANWRARREVLFSSNSLIQFVLGISRFAFLLCASILSLSYFTYLTADPAFRAVFHSGDLISAEKENWQVIHDHVVQESDLYALSRSGQNVRRQVIRNRYEVHVDNQSHIFLRSVLKSVEPAVSTQNTGKVRLLRLFKFDDGEWAHVLTHSRNIDEEWILDAFIPVQAGATWLTVQLDISAIQKWAHVDSRMYSAGTSSKYIYSMLILMFLWAALLIVVLSSLYRSSEASVKSILLMASVFIVIIFFTISSREWLIELIAPSVEMIRTKIAELNRFNIADFLSLGHAGMFFVLSFGLMCCRERLNFTWVSVFIVTASFAFATETLQLHISTRNSEISDLVFDISGSILGLIVFGLWIGSKKLIGIGSKS